MKKSNIARERIEYEVMLTRYELALRRKAASALARFYRNAGKRFEASSDTTFAADLLILQSEMTGLLETQGKRVVPAFAERTASKIVQMKAREYSGFFEDLVRLWLTDYALDAVESITRTSIEDVRKVIRRGVNDGDGTAAIGRSIRKIVSLAPYRADRIARTETHNASNFAAAESAKTVGRDLGMTLQKFWIPTLDERTRVSHAEMNPDDGIGLDETFEVGGEGLMYPGDPSGSPENTINCRCQLAHREYLPDFY